MLCILLKNSRNRNCGEKIYPAGILQYYLFQTILNINKIRRMQKIANLNFDSLDDLVLLILHPIFQCFDNTV